MNNITIIPDYKPTLSVYQTQRAIALLKRVFENALCSSLNLTRVSAPLFVDPSTGLNDDLSGVERPVSFDIPAAGCAAEVVHSLAKWKRRALREYGFKHNEGIVTDMNAIRRDEDLDNLHSIYVDQWDWEKIIIQDERTYETLRDAVVKIVFAICDTQDALVLAYPQLPSRLFRHVTFISSQELEDMYPDLPPKLREDEITRRNRTVFITQIGDKLRSGKPHDTRAPDYDDWTLNGDLLMYCHRLDCAMEISSMGVRVDAHSIDRQLKLAGAQSRMQYQYHRDVLAGALPFTIGGGIGQSRLSMLLLDKVHLGEVHSSVWDEETIKACAEYGIPLL